MSQKNDHRPAADWQSEAEAVRSMGSISHGDRLDVYPRLHMSERCPFTPRDHAALNESRAKRDLLHQIACEIAKLNKSVMHLTTALASAQQSSPYNTTPTNEFQNSCETPQHTHSGVTVAGETKSSLIHKMIMASGSTGRTDSEGAMQTGMDICNYRSLRNMLKVQDLVYKSGMKRVQPSGSTQTVWLARPRAEADQFRWGVRT